MNTNDEIEKIARECAEEVATEEDNGNHRFTLEESTNLVLTAANQIAALKVKESLDKCNTPGGELNLIRNLRAIIEQGTK